MKKPKASTMLAAAAVTLGLAGVGFGIVHAASSTTTSPVNDLVNAIATKFNLNTSDVQQVFNDQHAQMETQHQQFFKDQLAQAVTDGKLTQDQADKITAKMQELQAQHEADKTNMQNKTPEERKAAMEAERQALQQWVQENNIPMQYLHFGFTGKGHGPGGHGFGHRMNQPSPTSTTQSN